MNHDYLIIGSGMAGLTLAALLAKSGKSVGLIEAHNVPGGYAHTFSRGDYHFCAHVHYIWGCAPGQPIYEILKHLGLEQDITFETLNKDGYDHAVLPDNQRVKIPYGFDKLIDNISAAYPDDKQNLEQFINIITQLNKEIRRIPHHINWWHYLTVGCRALTLYQYKDKTLQDVFDECHLSQEVQAALCANAGNFAAPPEVLSILAYTSLFCGYNEGAYYPTKHFKYFAERLLQVVTESEGCQVYFNTKITQFELNEQSVTAVVSEDGRRFTASNYICNMDPQKAANLIGIEKFPPAYRDALSYEYSPSAFIIYCGVNGIDLRDYGFGDFNIWHQEQWNMNTAWKEILKGNFSKTWMFLSTPSLKSPDTTSTPAGGQTLEIGVITDYQYFLDLRNASPESYATKKRELSDWMLDIVEEKYVPNLRDHLEVKEVGTPLTNERFCLSPYGNCYGSNVTPTNMSLSRLNSKTPWTNLFWCNASSGYPGVYGTMTTAAYLYAELTGETVLPDPLRIVPTDEAIAYASH
jgi:phytoene dehydrogenase-like protein